MEHECYICTETKDDILLHDICMCRTQYVHMSCFETLLEKTKTEGKCTVCKDQYKNIIIKTKISINHRYVCFYIINCTFITSFLVFLIINIVTFVTKMLENIKFIPLCNTIYNNTIEQDATNIMCVGIYIWSHSVDMIILLFLLCFIVFNTSIFIRINSTYRNRKCVIKKKCITIDKNYYLGV